MRKHLGTLGVVAAIIALFALAMILGTRQAPAEGEAFVGTDSAATRHIEASQPGYSPWFKPLFAPSSGEVESGLFALQAAVQDKSLLLVADHPANLQTTKRPAMTERIDSFQHAGFAAAVRANQEVKARG